MNIRLEMEASKTFELYMIEFLEKRVRAGNALSPTTIITILLVVSVYVCTQLWVHIGRPPCWSKTNKPSPLFSCDNI